MVARPPSERFRTSSNSFAQAGDANMSTLSNYFRLFLIFARNSVIRDMMFRANFLIEGFSSVTWLLMNLGFYLIIFQTTDNIAGWTKFQFFIFIATTVFVNSLVQTFFMPNAEEFSELIRTGGLDFALLKPVDTQFLISLRKMEWSSLSNFIVALVLVVYGVANLDRGWPAWWQVALYAIYILAGTMILYSIMVSLAATSIWLGRNQSLYDFWFYITNFARYPMEIYSGRWGTPLRTIFTFIVPILVVINVPARIMAQPLQRETAYLALFAIFATVASLVFSRWIFQSALRGYRSASS